MNHSTTAWKPLFSVMKFYTFRNEFTPFVMSPIFHSVMKFYFLRNESAQFFIMKSYSATTSWRLDWWVLHRFTHLAVLQSPQTQHGGVQGLSLFIQSWLQTEFLLVLRIVTPVSVARTGSGICRQIVQFRTFCGGLTSPAGRVAGWRISVCGTWTVFCHALETPGALSWAGRQGSMQNGWCGGVSQDHGRAQNSSHGNHVVAFVCFDCGPHHMHVREW